MPTAEAVAEALATMPADAPWARAALRVLPTLRGDRIQVLEEDLESLGFRSIDEFPSLILPPGVEVTMAIDLEYAAVTVSRSDLDRWEMRIDDVLPAAMANLRRAVGTWDGTTYDDEYQGVPVRMLHGWPAWAASLLLSTDDLRRLFGSGDQLFVAPYACNLISMPVDVDRDAAADLVDRLGFINPSSLLINLPAFVMRGGDLTTEELPGLLELPDFDNALLAELHD